MDFDFKFESERDYEKFIQFLKQSGKEESIEDKERHKRIINTKREIYCIQMSNIRKIAKQIAKTDPYGFLKYVKNNTYEEAVIWGLVIVSLKSLDEQIKYLDKWKDIIDCWAVCDTVCSSMKILKNSKDKNKYFDYFYKLCFSDKEFVARLGIITLMSNFLEEEYIDRIYEMCEKISLDAYYVKMGIAWLISFGFIKFKYKTYKLLEKRVLDKFTQNKAICKCRDSFQISAEDKGNLINYRIK